MKEFKEVFCIKSRRYIAYINSYKAKMSIKMNENQLIEVFLQDGQKRYDQLDIK